MLIQGCANNNRFYKLIFEYNRLICSGIKPENILVILLNSYKKSKFINEIKKNNPNINLENNKIYTFWGLCYNAFNDNWKYISSLAGINEPDSMPNLCGLEISQYIFKQSIKTADFSDYISKINLLHQLFRRYSLIVQNSLSNEEVQERSELLNEVFYKDAKLAIDDYKSATINYKSFDYLRQLAVLPQIYKNTDYFNNIEYLFVDDADEFSYAFWQFINSIMPHIKDYYIAYDKDGSSRCGYLCAYKSGINDFKQKYPVKEQIIDYKTDISDEILNLFFAINNDKKVKLNKITSKKYSKRFDMLQEALKYTLNLIKSGIHPNEIAIVTPLIDDVLIKTLESTNYNINFQIVSGNEKLNNYNIIKHIIIILKLINNIPLKDYELKSLFSELLNIPQRKCLDIINSYLSDKILKHKKFEEDFYDFAYQKLYSLIQSEKKDKNRLSDEIKIIYTNIIKDFETNTDINKYDFLLKEAESFEQAFSSSSINLTEEFITQIENSMISENPIDSFSVKNNTVIVSSPQKIVDFSIHTKYQLWLDFSCNEWMKQDTGTLYNAWVLNRDWQKDKYTLEDGIRLTRDKAARIIRKLGMCAKEYIFLFSSIYDNTGNENFGGPDEFLEFNEQKQNISNIIPRDDQKPVLEYKNGKLAVMAVPGAGKTTILLLLIIKLINSGIKPENIFVLTYMESAAKNFKDKLQNLMPDCFDLPNISTIHGLALRIIKENSNYNMVGLDENFEIADDTIKEKIIRELFYKLKINEDNYDNYLKSISIIKLSGKTNALYSKYKDIQDFYNFYENYNKILKQQNLIDYDDMLYFAVKILQENQEIRLYYQNICKYIIEDEAQDSTDIQQKLILLLNGKNNNFVRCGDINQAITSTFTNSNIESFKKFIIDNKKVEMTSSQRCAKPIYNLANSLITEAVNNEEQKNAFYKITMSSTDNNPQSDIKPIYNIFDNEKEERNFIIEKIKEIIKKQPEASIAILLRLNSQVNEYNEIFLENGIKTSIRSDCLAQKTIYKIIMNILNIIQNPKNNGYILNLANEYSLNANCINYIKELKSPFIEQNIDDIKEEGLLQLFWDINYWLNNSSVRADILVLNIGLYYSKNSTDKSNSHLMSAFVRRLYTADENLEEIIKKTDYAAQKSASAYKFFEDENSEKDIMPVNIMTMHKAKGDEFDYVFIPELNEDNYSTFIKNVKIKSGSHFIQIIKNSVEKCRIKQQEELKQEQIEETLRLLYVGITRAKRELYFTNSLNYKRRKNTKQVEIIQKIVTPAIETK